MKTKQLFQTTANSFLICPMEGQRALACVITCKHIQTPYLGLSGIQTSLHPKDLNHMGTQSLRCKGRGCKGGGKEADTQLHVNPFSSELSTPPKAHKVTILGIGGKTSARGSQEDKETPVITWMSPLLHQECWAGPAYAARHYAHFQLFLDPGPLPWQLFMVNPWKSVLPGLAMQTFDGRRKKNKRQKETGTYSFLHWYVW